jgi:uncharacterized protein YegP (UPF0339 family)
MFEASPRPVILAAAFTPHGLVGMELFRYPLGVNSLGRVSVMAYSFHIYKDKAGEYRFRFKASNGEIMFGSEGYKAKASAVDAIDSIKKHASSATVQDEAK